MNFNFRTSISTTDSCHGLNCSHCNCSVCTLELTASNAIGLPRDRCAVAAVELSQSIITQHKSWIRTKWRLNFFCHQTMAFHAPRRQISFCGSRRWICSWKLVLPCVSAIIWWLASGDYTCQCQHLRSARHCRQHCVFHDVFAAAYLEAVHFSVARPKVRWFARSSRSLCTFRWDLKTWAKDWGFCYSWTLLETGEGLLSLWLSSSLLLSASDQPLEQFVTGWYRRSYCQQLQEPSGGSEENVRWTSLKTECLQVLWLYESVGSMMNVWCSGWL